MPGWFRHPLFVWAFRWRGFLVSALGLGGAGLLWESQSRAPWWSIAPLGLGLGLRIWARTYIGRHTRGAVLAAPVRACGGPYRWFGHPLYLANGLVAIGCLGALGAGVVETVVAALPVAFFYGALAMGESAYLRELGPKPSVEVQAQTGWSKEVWSLLPPLLGWALLVGVRGSF